MSLIETTIHSTSFIRKLWLNDILYTQIFLFKDWQTWMLNNRLKLTQAKTEFFVASSSHHYSSLQHLALNLDGHEIPSSSSIRNLGVIFDYSMTMAEHISNLSRSINCSCGISTASASFLILTHVTTYFALSFYPNSTTATLSCMALTKNISIVFKFFKTNVPG